MLVVLEAMLRAFDVFDEVVHVQLVVEGPGHRPSSVPVLGMENYGNHVILHNLHEGSCDKDCASSTWERMSPMLEKGTLSVMTFSPSSVRRTTAISCLPSGNSTMETKMFLDTKTFMCPLLVPTAWPMLTEISCGLFMVLGIVGRTGCPSSPGW